MGVIPKKLLIVNDMTGFGRCSIAVALPVISACKVQGIPVPTSVFSNHTGFPSYYKKDLTVYMTDYLNQLDRIAKDFDGIYCGYFGSLMQMHIMDEYIKKHLAASTSRRPVIIIDPVMGDHGSAYSSITTDFCNQMKCFIHQADLVTPNLTEACLLTDTPYHEGMWAFEELTELADKIAAMGPSRVVITGICDAEFFHNHIRSANGTHTTVSTPVAGSSRPGTGDIFASIVSALIMREYELQDAVPTASNFIAHCTLASDEAAVPPQEGVLFEQFLNELTVL